MRRRRKENNFRPEAFIKFSCGVWKLILTEMWWIFIVCLAGVFIPSCSGIHVFVKDEKRYAVPFQSVVLPCHYTTVSTQAVVVVWVYKSYCRDRTRDSFSLSDSLNGGLGGGGLQRGNGVVSGSYEKGTTVSYLDCSDSSRTVRTVASISGSSVTLSEFYKNRDISIINSADLRIGEIQWGDSGVYFCKVTVSDDLEGQNEASVELLVLGFSGVPEDLLPNFDLKIMPACNRSEVSSLHEGENGFRQTYRSVQKKALPAISDQDSQPQPHGRRDSRGPEPQQRHSKPSSPHRYRHDPDSDPHDSPDEPLLPRRYSDDPPPSSHSNRVSRNHRQQSSGEEDKHNRWNPHSEHLQRKTYRPSGRTGSLDELEEFAATYKHRGGRGAERREEDRVDYEVELLEFSRYPSYRNGPPQHYHSNENELAEHRDHEEHPREKKNRHNINVSPLASPQRRAGTVPPPPTVGPPSSFSREKDYDPKFLDNLLDRRAKLRGQVNNGACAEEESDTPSKGSSKKSSRESSQHCSRSPSTRADADSLYLESGRTRADSRLSPRPSPADARSSPSPHSLHDRREEPRDKSRKVNTLLSRDSLIV
ncbi:immunoglobulin-like domain-containing receptor 2 isoform X6 [Nothobranchius furzeri]|uniref:immunoglobulin-like domain-containing receptor 2 isoform X6 n=1 Tax=Nothobranchius furzeri TaxID=105023 RepID=UPI003904D1AF